MTFDDFIQYLHDNSGSEYNMKSIINTINNIIGYKYKYNSDSIQYKNLHYIAISDSKYNAAYALLYYEYIERSDNYENDIICPTILAYCDNSKEIRFNKLD